MTLVLDTGALLAYERGDRTVRAFLVRAHAVGRGVRTTSGVVAQVWRDGARQVPLVRLLKGVEEVELDQPAARRVGKLIGVAGLADVVDGSVIDAAVEGDEILTSDPDDIVRLAAASEKTLIVTPV